MITFIVLFAIELPSFAVFCFCQSFRPLVRLLNDELLPLLPATFLVRHRTLSRLSFALWPLNLYFVSSVLPSCDCNQNSPNSLNSVRSGLCHHKDSFCSASCSRRGRITFSLLRPFRSCSLPKHSVPSTSPRVIRRSSFRHFQQLETF
jgi:hypothetical protein